MCVLLPIWICITFLCTACDQSIQEGHNITVDHIITTKLAKELKNRTTSSRIPGEISKRSCAIIGVPIDRRRKRAADLRYMDTVSGFYNQTNKYDKVESTTSTTIPRCRRSVVGGSITRYQEFPHMALLGYETNKSDVIQWNCGGSLISEIFVLTAAHCVTIYTSPPKFVRLGATNKKKDWLNVQQRMVNESIVYPDYTPTDKYHDIALLRLERAIYVTGVVYPACLHTEKYISHKNAIATGWGATEYTGPDSEHLLKVSLDFYTTEDCAKNYESEINKTSGFLRRGIDDDSMICAGSTEEIKNTCQGDSGGPLQVHLHKRKLGNHVYVLGKRVFTICDVYEIVGVTSFGRACSLHKGVPGVYTRVSNYIKWIEDIVWPE